MLRNWFGSRTLRSPERNRFFRPRLEFLEGRLAPSSIAGAMDDNGGGDDNNHGNDNNQGNEPPGQERHEHINRFDNYDMNQTGYFPIVFNNLNVNNYFSSAGMSTSQLDKMLITDLVQAVQTTPGATLQDAFSLVSSEVQLAQDSVALVSGIISGANSQTQQALVQDIHNLQSAIQGNALEGSVYGQLAGTVAFNLGIQAALPQLNAQASASASASASGHG